MSTALFWSLLAGMTLVALAFVLLPLLRGRTISEVSRRDSNIALYRERLREIEQSVETGDISAEDASAIKTELDARLLTDVGPAANSTVERQTSRTARAMSLILLVLLPGLSIGIYLHNSDWQLALVGNSPAAVPLLLRRLERHLEKQPTDVEGWRLLAKSQTGLQRFEEAARSYARLNALAPNTDSLVGEAEVLALAAGGSLQGRPEGLIAQALRLEANHARALWYAGLAARQRNDHGTALRHWDQLAQQTLPEDFRKLLDTQIVQAGGKPPRAPETFQIPVQVSLDPQLANRVSPDMPVFVYARAQGQGGPPLAVMRRQVSELPLTVVLDDSTSMLPDRKLSSVDRWTITARIARAGSAETRSGDPVAELVVTRAQLTGAVRLNIQRVAP